MHTQNHRPQSMRPIGYRHRDPSPLGITRDGFIVRNRSRSHLHLDSKLIEEAIGRIEAPKHPFAKITVPMGRTVGVSECVNTSPADEIIFAQRRGRTGLTRFVKNRTGTVCDSIVVVLLKTEGPRELILITAFIGDDAEPEPWDPKATSRSHEFWSDHALIYRPQDIVPGTETSRCPW